MQVNQAFFVQGDGMHNSAALLPELLEDGKRLLVYAGNADGMCNFMVCHVFSPVAISFLVISVTYSRSCFCRATMIGCGLLKITLSSKTSATRLSRSGQLVVASTLGIHEVQVLGHTPMLRLTLLATWSLMTNPRPP